MSNGYVVHWVTCVWLSDAEVQALRECYLKAKEAGVAPK